MRYIFLSTLFLLISLHARENPFFPSAGEKSLTFTSNESTTLPKLKRASTTLPSNARVIKKVTIEYENLDASMQTKIIELNHTIDWHLPVFVSQSFSEQATQKTPITKPRPQKSTTIKKKESSFKSIVTMKHGSFLHKGKTLKILSKDALLRDFLLGKPHRIVMDFKKDSDIKSYIKKIQKSVFTKVRIGNHEGYYRVVIELDGYYRYQLQKLKDGYLIGLH